MADGASFSTSLRPEAHHMPRSVRGHADAALTPGVAHRRHAVPVAGCDDATGCCKGLPKTSGRGEMPQFAVLIYSDDSAHEPDKTAATSDEITLCDEHAV